MAKKFRNRIDNNKPNYDATERTISRNGVQINGVIKNVYNEVGKSDYSSHVGTDPNGQPLQLITYANRDPLMVRFEYIRDYAGGLNSDTDQIEIDSILSSPNYSYDHDTEFQNKGKKQIFRYENKSRPYTTYDEEYFQHIFNWPTSHTLKERTVGAFIDQTNTCTGAVTTFEHAATYPGGSMTLDKVVSELYYIDDKWGYQPLNLNADGSIQDSTGEITDKLGEPIIYHGGTDDNCLFFHYVVDLVDTNAVSTDNLVVVGDTINGATVTNVVNYVTDIALKRIVSKHPKKGDIDVDTTAQRFIDLGYTQSDFDSTKSWLKLNTSDGLAKGMTVAGRGIREGTVVTAVDEDRNRVYLSETLNDKKVKIVRFFDDLINKVNKNTLCYATISGGSGFAVDTNYQVLRGGSSTGITVCARAGKGIINRSAIVGTYFSKNKKEIEYTPIFYSADPNCEKSYYEDDNGVYILGTVVWDDGSRDEGKYLLTEPKTTESYRIATIYTSFTYSLIDKDTLELFITNENSPNYINIYDSINSYVKTNLNGKKAAANFDDICRDDLVVNYSLAYFPLLEDNDIKVKVSQISSSVEDDCRISTDTVPTVPSIDDFKKRIKDIVDKSVESSTFLSEDYYKRLVSNEDSLLNRLSSGTNLINNSVPTKTKVDNSPPIIEGQDDSGVRWIAKNFRDLPPAMDRVKFFIGDVLVARDKDLDASLNLDPATTVNQPKIIIRSKPRWIWGGANSWSNTKTHIGCPASWTSTIAVTVNLDSEGYLDTITSNSLSNSTVNSADDINEAIGEYNLLNALAPIALLQGEQNISAGVGISPAVEIIICEGDPPTIGTCSRAWSAPSPKDANKNINFGEKAEPWDFTKVSSEQVGYISATNWDLNPNLRDLDNIDRSDDSDILNPTISIYPKTIWAPNINYQMDFHKMFNFRMEELSELIGESIENSGNPYLDDPIRAKIRRTIQPGDTTITVDSTDGFLSSGYLIIPKYCKKLFTTETGNVDSQFTYCGEEIIYYKSKTATTFENCERELFGTTSDFEITLPAHSMETGVRYRIESLGTTNWENVGAGKNAEVGTVFVATKDGDGSGTVQIFGSNSDEIASENIDVYEDPPKIPVISSYETGFSVSQHWIFALKED